MRTTFVLVRRVVNNRLDVFFWTFWGTTQRWKWQQIRGHVLWPRVRARATPPSSRQIEAGHNKSFHKTFTPQSAQS